ncbi:GNAT family N-acetyltransferase [Lacticaseibacillus daqingensis]|uniref:GNAT family N-acetyltransferase n=1 Tax=Lacticaseibacillus daqingensis TaxID=2486014 RepID=UPI000F783D01|nr:GNAT family N-acetyltransferase [Lacticaseibacillus daqingensis]
MTREEIAHLIFQQNRTDAYYSAFVEDTETGIAGALADPGVRVAAGEGNLAVLDEYTSEGQAYAEIWGPYPLLSGTQVPLDQALDQVLTTVAAGTVCAFFIDGRNLLRPLLEARGFTFRQQTIWQMAALPQPRVPIARYLAPPPDWIATQIAELQRRNHFSSWHIAATTGPTRPLFVIQADGHVMGYAQGELGDERDGHLLFVVVAEAYRRRGLAKALMAALYTDLTSAGATTVTLVQAASAASAAAAYQACGFTQLRTVVSANRVN